MYISHRILPNYAAESKGLPTLMKSKKQGRQHRNIVASTYNVDSFCTCFSSRLGFKHCGLLERNQNLHSKENYIIIMSLVCKPAEFPSLKSLSCSFELLRILPSLCPPQTTANGGFEFIFILIFSKTKKMIISLSIF